MKEIIHIIVIAILSLILGALFLKIEMMDEELKKDIPTQVHALVENTIRESMREEFEYERQTYKLIIEDYE